MNTTIIKLIKTIDYNYTITFIHYYSFYFKNTYI